MAGDGWFIEDRKVHRRLMTDPRLKELREKLRKSGALFETCDCPSEHYRTTVVNGKKVVYLPTAFEELPRCTKELRQRMAELRREQRNLKRELDAINKAAGRYEASLKPQGRRKNRGKGGKAGRKARRAKGGKWKGRR